MPFGVRTNGNELDRLGPAPIGVGLLGVGWVAELAHVPTLLHSARARLVAAADPDPARLAWLRRRAPAAKLHSSWEPVLADPGVQAVLVAVPTAGHRAAAEASFDAGKHVFLEKPLALTVADGRSVVLAWRRAGTVGAIGYNFRRNPIAEAAARALAAGSLGELLGIQASFQWAADAIRGWRAEPGAGGGALVDLLSHHVDLIGALTGKSATWVQATIRSVRSVADTATVELDLDGDLSAQLFGTSAAGSPANRLDLIGRLGTLRVDLLAGRLEPIARRPGPGARASRLWQALGSLHPARLLRSPGFEPSFRATLDAFLAAVQTGSPAKPDLFDGLRVLAVIEAATRSAAAGGRIEPVEAVE